MSTAVDVSIIISLISLAITLIVFLSKLIKAITTLEVTVKHFEKEAHENKSDMKEITEKNGDDHRRIHKRIDDNEKDFNEKFTNHEGRIKAIETNQEICRENRRG